MKNDHGFTLIEIIMVIVIISILAFVAITKSPITGISLETAADMIKSDIRSVQALAMAQHTTKSMTFGSNIYTFDALDGMPETAEDPRRIKKRNLSDIFDGQLTISAPTTIGFNSLGEPTSTTSPGDSISITSGSSTKTLTVLRYTGRVYW